MSRTVHYVLSTHWDREWYQTFQDYRARLVALLDRTIDDIAAGRLRGPFTMDGQAILIEDYLEVRRHRAEQVRRMLRDGKLVAGPWYVLPDEWLVSGEALIRNLRLGRQIVRELGATPSDAGFVCDLFGHVSQLPQIFRGFGIDVAFIWRGIDPPASGAHVHWRGADGSEVLAYRFGRTGYCDYTFDVRQSHRPGQSFDRARASADLETFLKKEADRAGDVQPILLFDGGDHLQYDADHYALLFESTESKTRPYKILHSTLDAYAAEAKRYAAQVTATVDGELRQPAASPPSRDQQWLIPGVLSSRVWIKQANAECQTLLCAWAEPTAAMAQAWVGHPAGAGDFLAVAWKWLLQNHPHDSICGCSVDAVHEDMKYRFAQCRQIAERLTDDATRAVASAVDGAVEADELRVVVFNPLPRPLREPVELTLQIPHDWPTFNEFFGFEPKPAFRLFDPDGAERPYQRLAQSMNRLKSRIRTTKYPQTYRTNDVVVSVPLDLPAMGYAMLRVRRGEQDDKGPWDDAPTLPTRHPARPGMATGPASMENEHLSVAIQSNGTVSLTDRRSGQTYSGLLTFEDSADIGDGWYHGPPVADQVFVSVGAPADVALLHDGPQQCTFRVRLTMRVPAAFEVARSARSERLVEMVIDSRLTLRRGCDRLEVVSTVHNAAEDHRLRVLFPTGAVGAKTYLSDGAFDVLERPIGLPDDTGWRELAVETTPQQSWTAVVDGSRGLAVVSRGLFESTVRDQPDRPIALTLFRATGRTVMTDGEPGGQLPGPMTFRFWVVPVAGEVDRSRLFDLGAQLAAGVRATQLRGEDVAIAAPVSPKLSARASFLNLDGPAVLSSVRDVAGRLEVRLFNPEDRRIAARLAVPGAAGATLVDFESTPTGEAPVRHGEIDLSLDAKQIVTVSIQVAQSRQSGAGV